MTTGLRRRLSLLLDPQWDAGPNADLDMTSLWSKNGRCVQYGAGAVFRESGDADQGLAQADKMITAEYRLPFQSHAPLGASEHHCARYR